MMMMMLKHDQPQQTGFAVVTCCSLQNAIHSDPTIRITLSQRRNASSVSLFSLKNDDERRREREGERVST